MYTSNKFLTILGFFFGFLASNAYGQQNYQAATVAFYNVENLFDTIVSVDYIDGTRDYTDPLYHISIPEADIHKYDTVYFRGPYNFENLRGKKVIRPLILQDSEFSPKGNKVWTGKRYKRKLELLAKAIEGMGKDMTNNAPVIVGLCEVETYETIEDLANEPLLKPYDYGVVHFNSFDARGIDVGLMYQKSRFKVTKAQPYPVELRRANGSRYYTRDILRVTGLLDGEEFTFLVNHWPSRSGGEKRSMPNRMEAAKVMKSIFDEIRAENPDAKIIAMGDFNDDPGSPSIKKGMGTVGDKSKLKKGDIYNPMEAMFKKGGVGTLAYRDAWNLFDQFLVTEPVVEHGKSYDTYKIRKVEIYNPQFLITPDGQWKGYPYRMFGGDTYHEDGTSDHFPIYTVLLRKVD